MIVAHIAGVPVEELLPSAAAVSTGLVVARAWVSLRLRRHRGRRA